MHNHNHNKFDDDDDVDDDDDDAWTTLEEKRKRFGTVIGERLEFTADGRRITESNRIRGEEERQERRDQHRLRHHCVGEIKP